MVEKPGPRKLLGRMSPKVLCVAVVWNCDAVRQGVVTEEREQLFPMMEGSIGCAKTWPPNVEDSCPGIWLLSSRRKTAPSEYR